MSVISHAWISHLPCSMPILTEDTRTLQHPSRKLLTYVLRNLTNNKITLCWLLLTHQDIYFIRHRRAQDPVWERGRRAWVAASVTLVGQNTLHLLENKFCQMNSTLSPVMPILWEKSFRPGFRWMSLTFFQKHLGCPRYGLMTRTFRRWSTLRSTSCLKRPVLVNA